MNKDSKDFPILTTERLTLRRLLKSDSEEILWLRSDADINKFLDRKPSKTLEDALTFIKNIIENDDLFYWAITKTGEDKLIGNICLFEFSGGAEQCEIGYELLTEHQNQGFMLEAAEKVVAFARETLRVKNIDALTHTDNLSSTGLLLKLGFKELGTTEDNQNLILFRLSK